jgi:hypothetical protein
MPEKGWTLVNSKNETFWCFSFQLLFFLVTMKVCSVLCILYLGGICSRFFCHLLWKCDKPSCLGCLNEFKGNSF